jgi:REP element-mobilizing transposase RayT
MSRTLGFHVIKSTYGTWLPGDSRGSWSEAWSPQRGFYEAHRFHEGDERRLDISVDRMRHAPLILDAEKIAIIVGAITMCVERSNGDLRIVAAAIEPTHMHLLIVNVGRDIDVTAKWLADQTTKAIHRQTSYRGPIWTKNNWCHHIDQQDHWENAIVYIDEHNVRAGRGSRPYPFLAPRVL